MRTESGEIRMKLFQIFVSLGGSYFVLYFHVYFTGSFQIHYKFDLNGLAFGNLYTLSIRAFL